MTKKSLIIFEINLASCISFEEVQDVLSLMTKDAIKSLVDALKNAHFLRCANKLRTIILTLSQKSIITHAL